VQVACMCRLLYPACIRDIDNSGVTWDLDKTCINVEYVVESS
jgi:hypothetical protein